MEQVLPTTVSTTADDLPRDAVVRGERPACSMQARVAALLGKPGAPRVFSPTTLWTWLVDQGETVSLNALISAGRRLAGEGDAKRVRRGLYLNLRAAPIPRLDEAAAWVRSGSVVSLQRVLGQAGVLATTTPVVTVVLRRGEHMAASGGRVAFEGGAFVFHTLAAGMFPEPGTPAWIDAYQADAQAPTATPEKALLDWLYLAHTRRGGVGPMRRNLDIGRLDMERLQRLAQRLGLQAHVDAFLAPVRGTRVAAGGAP